MKKIFFLPLIGAALLCGTSADASVLNDSESFRIARAMKLSEALDEGGPGPGSLVPYTVKKSRQRNSGKMRFFRGLRSQ